VDDGVFGDAGLAEAIGVVRGELEAAIMAGAASQVAFEAGPVELEFEVAFTKTGKGEAGVKWS
jgi:Trypsin-co-occurring domain 2